MPKRRADSRRPSATPSRGPQGTPRHEGYMANGPGFHVWEESHAEAVVQARRLADTLSVRQAQALGRRTGRDRSGDEDV